MGNRIGEQAPETMQSVYDGLFRGDFSENESGTKVATQIGVGLIPIVGQMADARDTIAAIGQIRDGRSGAWSNLGFTLAGWIPAAGDLVKSVHQVGVHKTISGIRSVIDSVAEAWTNISQYTERKLGRMGKWFYQPAVKKNADDLPYGAYGVTNRWGDIEIDGTLDKAIARSTLDHENVHQFLSPKLKWGQALRAKIGLLGYAESHLLRRTEEGIAEAWARFKAEGLTGIAKGWRFPYENPYGIDADRVRIERNLIIGTVASGAGAGAALRDQLENRGDP